MKCKFCGQENNDVNKVRGHMENHLYPNGGGLNVRQFLLCVQLFYGELPSVAHIKETIAEDEKKVDQAMKEMGIAE